MTTISYDLHTHTTYSDGWDWQEMVEAASDVGLTGIGFTDHCPIVDDGFGRLERYDFADTFGERRAEFRNATDEFSIDVLDGAEINWDPRAADSIETFLERAGFDYTIGSVHTTDVWNVAAPEPEAGESYREQVATYVDWQIELIESELFDVLGHLDLPRRAPGLREAMCREDYERIGDALAESRTVPELNAGRLDRDLASVHPDPTYLEVFAERNIPFVIGTDSHAPDQLTARVELLEERVEAFPVRVRALPPRIATVR